MSKWCIQRLRTTVVRAWIWILFAVYGVKLFAMGARSVLSVGQGYRFVLCLCIQWIDCAVVTLYSLIVRVHLLGVDVDGSTYRKYSIQLSSSA